MRKLLPKIKEEMGERRPHALYSLSPNNRIKLSFCVNSPSKDL